MEQFTDRRLSVTVAVVTVTVVLQCRLNNELSIFVFYAVYGLLVIQSVILHVNLILVSH